MNNFAVTSYVTTCIIIFTIFSLVLRFRRRRRLYEQAAKFPGPPTLPIIGNAHLLTGSTEDILNKLFEVGKSYPVPYRVWIANYLIFVVNTPEQLKVVLNSPKTINKGDLFDMAQAWVGTGLLTASDTKWRVHRKLIQPTFSTTILQSFVEIFSARSAMMAKEMERNLNGPEFDINTYATLWALHTTCETTMGVDLTVQTNDNGYYAEAAEKTMTSIFRRVISPWLHPDFIFQRTSLGKEQQKHIKFLHTFANNVIRTKKKEILEQTRCDRSNLTDNAEDTGDRLPRRKVLLDHLIDLSRDGKKLSAEELREEVDTIIAAGSDTTAVTSSYVMLMLASHPEIQETVYQELCEIYGDDDSKERDVIPEDLQRMTYLERVIKETLRLFPIVPAIIREVTDDLDIGDRTFPAGSLVVISLIELHRNGDIWPDPMKFDPDRFLPEEVKKRDSYTYLPFSGGPRTCIGSKYGMMSMKTLLATILRRYVLKKDNATPVKDLRVKWEFVMRPVDPITIRIEKRSRRVSSI